MEQKDQVRVERLTKSLENIFELTSREREIIKMRYGLIAGVIYTHHAIALRFRVTSDRVEQLERKAIRKLQRRRDTLAHGGFIGEHI